MQRRAFLKDSSLALFAAGLGGLPNFLRAAAQHTGLSSPWTERKILICIFQRGAMDGIAAVQPLNDPNLARLRPGLTLEAGTESGQLFDLDGSFGLHPALRPLARLFREERLSIVHGVGSPHITRSHFDAQDYMETGTPGRKGTPSGWLNRAVGQLPQDGTPFRALSLTPALPRSLYGPNYALAVERLEDLQIGAGLPALNNSGQTAGGFEALYRQTSEELLRESGSISLDAAQILQEANLGQYQASRGVRYPNSNLGNSLQQIAQLIKAGVGLEVAFTESSGWDTHARQGGQFGGFNRQASDLARCVTNFWKDLGPLQDQVVVMTMTEFGRTIHQNGSNGTDHGRGSCLFVLGNDVAGGQILGQVPTLSESNLEDGRDLPVTTDFRSVFAGVAEGHLGISSSGNLFPNWSGTPLSLFH